MGETILGVVVATIFAIMFFSDEIAQVISARKSKQLEIEKELTEQKRLDLEIVKVNAGLVPSTEG